MKHPKTLLAALLTVLMASIGNAVTLSVSPASMVVTNQQAVTISISGLTNGETVVLEKILDLKGDGVVDATDPITERAVLTDGFAPVIDRLRNPNIPGDDDSRTNGQITAILQPGRELDKIAGKFIFRVSSPRKRFLSVTRTVSVTQPVAPSAMAGMVTLNGAPVASAVVCVFSLDRRFVAGSVASSAGVYSIACDPGDYLIGAWSPTKPCVGTLSGPLTLVSGHTNQVGLTVVQTNRTITGVLRDSPGHGLPGVELFLFSAKGQFTVGLSDSSGEIAIPVLADEWTLAPSVISLAHLGVVGFADPATLDVRMSNAVMNLQFPVVNSLIRGSVLGIGSNIASGLEIQAMCSSSPTYVSASTCQPDGSFVIGSIGSQAWNISLVAAPRNTEILWYSQAVSTAPGAASKANLSTIATTNKIQGHVSLDGKPAAGFSVAASSISGMSSAALADSEGYFELPVLPDSWRVAASDSDRFRPTLAPSLPYAAITNDTVVNILVKNCPYTISGWISDFFGAGLPSIGVSAITFVDGNAYVASATSDALGHYSLNVFSADWTVQVDSLFSAGYNDVQPLFLTVDSSTTDVDFTALPAGPLAIATSNVPPVCVQKDYVFQLQATGGAPPYLWTLVSGTLPTGLSLAPSGEITGTVLNIVHQSITVKVQDDAGSEVQQSFSIAALSPPALTFLGGTNGALVLLLKAPSGQTCIVEHADEIAGPWIPVSTNLVADPNSATLIIPSGSRSFYRALAR